MELYKLPDSFELSGRTYKIRTDYRAILDILFAMNDPDIFSPGMTEEEKNEERILTMLEIFYEDFSEIPYEDYKEAAEKAKEFIDCGISGNEKQKKKLMDWKQDAPLIIPAINRVIGHDIRKPDTLHWWTFLSYYMEIEPESFYSKVVGYRYNRSKGKKEEKYEKEFYKENKKFIDLNVEKVSRSQEELEELRALFGYKKKTEVR